MEASVEVSDRDLTMIGWFLVLLALVIITLQLVRLYRNRKKMNLAEQLAKMNSDKKKSIDDRVEAIKSAKMGAAAYGTEPELDSYRKHRMSEAILSDEYRSISDKLPPHMRDIVHAIVLEKAAGSSKLGQAIPIERLQETLRCLEIIYDTHKTRVDYDTYAKTLITGGGRKSYKSPMVHTSDDIRKMIEKLKVARYKEEAGKPVKWVRHEDSEPSVVTAGPGIPELMAKGYIGTLHGFSTAPDPEGIAEEGELSNKNADEILSDLRKEESNGKRSST